MRKSCVCLFMDKNEKTWKRPGASLSRIGLRLQDFTPQKMLKCNVELSKRGIALIMIMARLRNSIKQMHPSHGLNSIKKALLTAIVPETCGMLLGLTNPNNSTGSSVNPILWWIIRYGVYTATGCIQNSGLH